MATPRESVLTRVRERANSHGDDFQLDEATAARYFGLFEPPLQEEGFLTIGSA